VPPADQVAICTSIGGSYCSTIRFAVLARIEIPHI
jgi:hypothetical protein